MCLVLLHVCYSLVDHHTMQERSSEKDLSDSKRRKDSPDTLTSSKDGEPKVCDILQNSQCLYLCIVQSCMFILC